MKILFIEDDDDKYKNVASKIQENHKNVEIERAKSLNGGLRSIIRSGPYNLLLLDMTMPNYDVTAQDPTGGTPEGFAGREIMMQMKLRGVSVPTVVITMFESYGELTKKISAKELDEELKVAFAPMYLGMVYYNSAQDEWHRLLNEHLNRID